MAPAGERKGGPLGLGLISSVEGMVHGLRWMRRGRAEQRRGFEGCACCFVGHDEVGREAVISGPQAGARSSRQESRQLAANKFVDSTTGLQTVGLV